MSSVERLCRKLAVYATLRQFTKNPKLMGYFCLAVLEYIEQLDAKYAPFAKQVRELARGFENDKILALVEPYLKEMGSA